jgi:transaldolase
VDVPVYVQLHGPNVDDYLREMEQLRRISDQIHPKLVSTHAGIGASKRIASTGAKPLVTTIATLSQAYLAASAGAAYVAPYIGRMVAAGVDAYQIVADIAALYQRHGIKTQITAASIASPEDAEKVLLAGAPVLVMQYSVFKRLLDSELTQAWIDRFEDNWSRIPLEIQSYEKENS